VKVLKCVANGDLTVTLEVDTKDEVGQMAAALNETIERLRSTLEEVNQSASNASTSSQQLASASEAISSGAGSRPRVSKRHRPALSRLPRRCA